MQNRRTTIFFALAILFGMIRTHDVRETLDAVRMTTAVLQEE